MSYVGRIGGFCIDKYEASVPGCDSSPGSNCADFSQSGLCDLLLCVPVSGVFGPGYSDTGTTVNATSRPNVVPIAGISQKQARQMCANAGKHLCTSSEWLAAANILGQVYNLPTGESGHYIPNDNSNTSTNCNTNYFCQLNETFKDNRVCLTGSRTDCRSSEGVYDMIGNLYEFVNETIAVIIAPGPVSRYYYINTTSMNWSTTNSADDGKYGKDGTYFVGNTTYDNAVLRGGTWDDGSLAGVFYANMHHPPINVLETFGFRCCAYPTESIVYDTYQDTYEVFSNFSYLDYSLLHINSSTWNYYTNKTGLSLGTYSYYGWANDTSRNSNMTDNGSLRYYTYGEPTTTTTTTTITNENCLANYSYYAGITAPDRRRHNPIRLSPNRANRRIQ